MLAKQSPTNRQITTNSSTHEALEKEPPRYSRSNKTDTAVLMPPLRRITRRESMRFTAVERSWCNQCSKELCTWSLKFWEPLQ